MTTRYTLKKWWSMKEDPEGQYVAYPEHQETLDALRYENDKLWERIAQQVKEFDDLQKDRKEWIARHGALRTLNENLKFTLRKTEITAWCFVAAFVITILFITAFGVLTWH